MKDMLSCPSCVPPSGGHAACCILSVFVASSEEDCADRRASPVTAEVPSFQISSTNLYLSDINLAKSCNSNSRHKKSYLMWREVIRSNSLCVYFW